jgi:hypothetical protein
MCGVSQMIHYNNFLVKTNMKQEIKHTQEILISGNAFASFHITVMISLHGTWTWVV